ncbi:hypothetical protein T01_16194 [Trichinella spiralis]|uniref:Uncharacterized protein n=1 Tax=Trichinella spiralis TaxID=6334 RepID=A0A0V1C086_TRISP|nr:hypothetical protein T01_16194 [Trichinella spiralis]
MVNAKGKKCCYSLIGINNEIKVRLVSKTGSICQNALPHP